MTGTVPSSVGYLTNLGKKLTSSAMKTAITYSMMILTHALAYLMYDEIDRMFCTTIP